MCHLKGILYINTEYKETALNFRATVVWIGFINLKYARYLFFFFFTYGYVIVVHTLKLRICHNAVVSCESPIRWCVEPSSLWLNNISTYILSCTHVSLLASFWKVYIPHTYTTIHSNTLFHVLYIYLPVPVTFPKILLQRAIHSAIHSW